MIVDNITLRKPMLKMVGTRLNRTRYDGAGRALACAAVFMLPIVLGARVEAQTPEEICGGVVEAIQTLFLGEEAERIAAAEKLGTLRAVYSVPALESALGDPSQAVRKAAVKTLGSIAHKSAIKALQKAAGGEDQDMALLAIQVLGDMHMDESFSVLLEIIGSTKDAARKEAVLDGLRKWNLPFTPLPAAVTIQEGLKGPDLPESKKPTPLVEPPEPEPETEKGKKPEVKIVETKPLPPATGITIEKIDAPPPGAGITIEKISAPLSAASIKIKKVVLLPPTHGITIKKICAPPLGAGIKIKKKDSQPPAHRITIEKIDTLPPAHGITIEKIDAPPPGAGITIEKKDPQPPAHQP